MTVYSFAYPRKGGYQKAWHLTHREHVRLDRLTRGLSYKDLYSRWTPEQESEALHEDPNWHGYLASARPPQI